MVKSNSMDIGWAFIYKKADDPDNLHAGFSTADGIYDLGAVGDLNAPAELTEVKRFDLYGKTIIKYQSVFGSHVLNTRYFSCGNGAPEFLLSVDGLATELDINKDGVPEIVVELCGTIPATDIYKWNGTSFEGTSVGDALGVRSVLFNKESGEFLVAGEAAGIENLRYRYSGEGLKKVSAYGPLDDVLSENAVASSSGAGTELLRIKMVQGKKYEDREEGPYKGWNWQGRFEAQLVDDRGAILSSLDLNKAFQSEELVFNGPFLIMFDDLNNDGSKDFAIGQYGSSNGNFYRLFTVRDHKVELLPVEKGEIFSGGARSRYTAEFEKLGASGFINRYYDNVAGKMIEQYYTWDGSGFVLKPEK